MNLAEIQRIIDSYRESGSGNPGPWIQDCENAATLEEAVELATTSRTRLGRKNFHQWRIPNAILIQFRDEVLGRIALLNGVTDFHTLISMIGGCKVRGIGALTVYDAALRIGGYLNLRPERVYLHSKVRVGAENLLGKISDGSILISQLPQPFQDSNLTCAEVEDILCHYRNELLTCVE